VETLAFNAAPGFFGALVLIPVIGVAVLLVMHWMFEQIIPFWAGMIAIIVSLLMLAAGVLVPEAPVIGTVMFGVLTGIAFFPFVLDQLATADLRRFHTERLERAHQALSERPDNVAAIFALTESLYEHGMLPQAIRVSERTLHGLSQDMDPLTNRSSRDLYAMEERRVKKWYRELKGKDPFRDRNCPECGRANPPHEIRCLGCGGAYLLHLARRARSRERMGVRLGLAYAALGAYLTSSAIAVERSDREGWMFLLIGLPLVGLAIFLLTRVSANA